MDWQAMFAQRTGKMVASEIRELLKLLDQPDIISFAGGIPDPDLFPSAAFEAAFAEIFATGQSDAALQYSVSEGYLPLRNWIAARMATLGVPCDADNVVITSGSQQALDYLGKLLLQPRDTMLLGWPTYLGALGAFNAYEPNYAPLIVHGNRTADAIRQAAIDNGGRVTAAYVCADFANPTGHTLDCAARQYILDRADEMDIAVIEDAAYQALRYDGDPVPAILALEVARKGSIEACRTIYCGSFSKTLAPGLRVGWVCAAKPVIAQLVLMKQASDLHTPTLNQIVVERVVRDGFDDQVEKIRNAYRVRRDAMLAALTRHMPDGVTWTRPEGGMFVWLTLPDGTDGAAILAGSLERERVAFVPGRAFFADGSGANTLRLSFSRTDTATINEGIARLGTLLRRIG